MPQITYETPAAFKDLSTPSRYKAYHGGRGGGKSHAVAAELVIRGYSRPLRVLCCRELQKSLSASVKQLLEDKIKQFGLEDFYNVTRDDIKGANGTLFIFAGLKSHPDTVRSMEGIDIAWVEEADKVSQRSLDILEPTIRKPGSELWFLWNRHHEKDPVDKMFLDGEPPPGSIIHKVGWDTNPFFPDVLRRKMLWQKERDRDAWLHIWEGHPVAYSAAQIFKNWRTEDVDDAVDWGEAVPRLGADWGYSIDPTCVIECYVGPGERELYFRRERWQIGCDVDELPSFFAGDDWRSPQRWMNRYKHPGLDSIRRGHKVVADTGRGDLVRHLSRRGLQFTTAKKGPGSIIDGITFMQSHDIIVHPSCENLIDELTHYRYKIDPQTEEVVRPAVPQDKHNHVIDAARYALEAVRRAQRPRVGLAPPRQIPLEGA